jgi:predicted Rossmann fold nucleotide-binding protein DprA/Smf involved in DNA uptake
MIEIVRVTVDGPFYPSALRRYLGDVTPRTIAALGNLDALHSRQVLALFCSVKCPGDLILKTYDLARNLRQAGVTVISGET